MLTPLLLNRLVRRGQLTIVAANGDRSTFGGLPGDAVTIRVADPAFARKFLLDQSMAIGEAYMDGALTIEEGDLYLFLKLLMENAASLRRPWIVRAVTPALGAAQQLNSIRRSRRNVAHHYDLSGRLYDLFLDADRQYSCAYFQSPSDDLETAQSNKKRHIAAKLLLEPGMKVLDIGSGWGGMALYLARETGADVTGLTLSIEQQKAASERARAEGLAGRVRFVLRDYREEDGAYDRIVSVGMFEHVGAPHYRAFFRKIHDLLKPDGVALVHSIGRANGPGVTNSWLRKYIFPGGYSPALSQVLPHVERERLWLTDVEILRLHYAETLRHWRARFAANRAEIATLYDERFCRMWEFFLTASELRFRVQECMNFQLQLTRKVDAAPATRDYMIDWERAHRAQAPARSVA